MTIKEHTCITMPDTVGIQFNEKRQWHFIEWDTWVFYGIKYCPFCGVKLK